MYIVIATIGIVFKNDQQAAYAQNRFSQAVAFLTALILAGFINVKINIYIQISIIFSAFVSYIIFHFVTVKELQSEPVNQDDKIDH